jgi:hypothetical protein
MSTDVEIPVLITVRPLAANLFAEKFVPVSIVLEKQLDISIQVLIGNSLYPSIWRNQQNDEDAEATTSFQPWFSENGSVMLEEGTYQFTGTLLLSSEEEAYDLEAGFSGTAEFEILQLTTAEE